MNAELEKIVDSVLGNGELTDRSRELLMKKAEQLGVDSLDFELELESKIAQKKASTNGPLPIYTSNTPKSNKVGDLKKCPSCGAPVKSFASKCSDCDHEFRGIEATKSISTLLAQLREVEENVMNKKRNLYERIMDPTGVLMSPHRDVEIAKAKSKILSTFPVPNSKEDILEILSTAVAQYRKGGVSFNPLSFIGFILGTGNAKGIIKRAWRSKSEEVVIKARLSMKEDKRTLEEIESYAKQLKIK